MMVCTPPIAAMLARCDLTDSARSRVVRIQVRGTSWGMSRRVTFSARMRGDSK